MSSENNGAQFLHERYDQLHKSPEVKISNKTIEERKKRDIEEDTTEIAAEDKTIHNEVEAINNWLEMVSEMSLRHNEDPKVKRRVKNFYHKKYVIEPENVPESYFDNQRRIAREQGHGDIVITEGMRKNAIAGIREDQKQSLDRWISYLGSSDAEEAYPTWARYWAFRGMTELSQYDKEEKKFKKRSIDTVAPFPDLNHDALGFAIGVMEKRQGEEFHEIQDEIDAIDNKLNTIRKYEQEAKIVETGLSPEGKILPDHVVERLAKKLKEPEDTNIEELSEKKEELLEKQIQLLHPNSNVAKQVSSIVELGDFGDIYALGIERLSSQEAQNLKNTEGKWIKYEQGTDAKPLYQSLQGYNTGWCTAGGISTAETQLSNGDFYVYYSYADGDKDDNPTIPRVAIRMSDNEIAEVRGIAARQNLDPYIGEVTEGKLDEFGEKGKVYKKKAENMRRLTEISNALDEGNKISYENLIFLYEINEDIQGFGYEKDPRIKEYRTKEHTLVQLENMLDDPNADSLFEGHDKDAIQKKNRATRISNKYKDIEVQGQQNEKIDLTKKELQTLYLDLVFETWDTNNEDEEVFDDEYEEWTRRSEIINLRNIPEDISELFECEPEEVSTSVRELLSGKKFVVHYGDIELTDNDIARLKRERARKNDRPKQEDPLSDYENMLYDISEDYEATMRFTAPYRLSEHDVQTANPYAEDDGALLPTLVCGTIQFNNDSPIDTIRLPEMHNVKFYLNGNRSVDELEFSEKSTGEINLSLLRNFSKLSLPKEFEGEIKLGSVKSFYNVDLPETFKGKLSCPNIQELGNLIIPEEYECDIFMDGYNGVQSNEDKLKFPENYRGTISMNGLLYAGNIEFPRHMEGTVNLANLETARGLVLPETLEGDLNLARLQYGKRTNLPNSSMLVSEFLRGRPMSTRNIKDFNDQYMSTQELVLPQWMKGNLNIYSLDVSKDVQLPETLYGKIIAKIRAEDHLKEKYQGTDVELILR